MASSLSPKLGIYFSHYECFGHTARVMAMAEVFKRRYLQGKIFFIQAGLGQPRSRIGQWGKVYPLPGAFMNRRSFKAANLPFDVDKRARLCEAIVAREKPGLLISEYFPLGHGECRHELLTALVKASAQGALWAAAGYPLLTGKSLWRKKVLALYQHLFIFSSALEREFIAGLLSGQEKREYLDFFEQNASKILFAGYLLPRQEVVEDDEGVNRVGPPVAKGACRVAVLRGGGVCYPKLIAQAIRASDLLGQEYHFTVVAGPSTTAAEWRLFKTMQGKKKIKNLILLGSLGGYEKLIKESDVCVSTAGYHTGAMLLKHRKKAVLVPFEGYGAKRHYEQPARAALLREILGAEILSIKTMTAAKLRQAIQDAAGRPAVKRRIPEAWFTGADVLDKALRVFWER
ncbi:MAG: hypothetical protein KGK03_00675 [Candidatus Omnitrophica bacterium]|nr:hypothetical protein [Candidatus Omnitrophota bacterium]